VAEWLQRVRESSRASAVTGGDEKGFGGRAHSQQAIGRGKGTGPMAGGRQAAEWLAGQALKPWRWQYLRSIQCNGEHTAMFTVGRAEEQSCMG
jgi:hypothetical protein